MPKFSVVFLAPGEKNQFIHRIIESTDKDSALRTFFTEETTEFYSNDEQGYYYFKEDFFDTSNPSGSIIPCE